MSQSQVRFAHSVRAEETGHAARTDAEGQVVNGEPAAVALGQPAQLDHGPSGGV
jgi:hypothetical protein